jgi:hypothetical protein
MFSLRVVQFVLWIGTFLMLTSCPQSSDDDVPQDSNGLVSGHYLIHQVGLNGSGIYTAQVEVTSNGDGTGTFNIARHSQGVVTPVPVPFTYSANANRTFSMNNGAGVDYGVVSNDGNKMITVDAAKNPPDSDSEIIMGVGLKSDCTVTTPLNGDYQAGQFEIDYSMLPPIISTARVDITFTDGNYSTVQHSGGGGGSDNFTYVLNANCTIEVNNNVGDNDFGITTADGSMFVLVDADASDNRLSLIIALKKSSGNDNTLFTGNYRLGMFAESTVMAVKTLYSGEVDVTSAGDGSATADILQHSEQPPSAGIPITYIVLGDGTYSVLNGVATDYGIVSSDGEFEVLVDADHTDGDDSIMLVPGIRY